MQYISWIILRNVLVRLLILSYSVSGQEIRALSCLDKKESTMWRLNIQPSCTISELTEIITAPTGGYYVIPTDPYNEVYPNILIGDAPTALCVNKLKRLGVTHVVNAAQGSDRNYGYVNTNATFYNSSGIEFLGIQALDFMSFKLKPFFEEAADFIEGALSSGGKVLVHCRQGISRSATLVLAFLMLKRGMTAQEAVRLVRNHREIIPNDGFLQQLCHLNEEQLVQKRRRRKSSVA